MAERSALRVSELRSPRSRRRYSNRQPTTTGRRVTISDELHDVADSLHSTNRRLDQADELFESYRELTERQDEDIAELEHELAQSDRELEQTRARSQVRRRPVVQFVAEALSDAEDSDTSYRQQRHAKRIASLVDQRRKAHEERLQDELDEVTWDLESEREQLNHSISERNHLAKGIARLEGHVSRVEQDKERIMSDLEESAREIDRHTSRQRRLRQQVADLRLQLSEAKQSETKHKRKVNELKQQYEESRISRERLAEQLEQTQNHLVKRENEIQSIEDTLHRSETTCSKLTGELDKALNKVDTLQRSNKHFIELNRRSEAGVTSREVKARKNYEKALEMIRKYKSHLQSVEGELAQCQENHSDLKHKYAAALEAKKMLQNDVEEGKHYTLWTTCSIPL